MKASIFGPVLDPNHITACSTSTDDMQHCAVQCCAANSTRYVDFMFTSNLTDQKKSHTQHTAAAAPPVSQLDWLLSRACTAKSTRPEGRCSTRHCLGQKTMRVSRAALLRKAVTRPRTFTTRRYCEFAWTATLDRFLRCTSVSVSSCDMNSALAAHRYLQLERHFWLGPCLHKVPLSALRSLATVPRQRQVAAK